MIALVTTIKALPLPRHQWNLTRCFPRSVFFFVALLKIKRTHEWQVSFHVLLPARIVDKPPDLGESQAELIFLLSKCRMDDGYPGSIGIVDLPTWMLHFNGINQCRYIYASSHGSVMILGMRFLEALKHMIREMLGKIYWILVGISFRRDNFLEIQKFSSIPSTDPAQPNKANLGCRFEPFGFCSPPPPRGGRWRFNPPI